MDLSKFKSLIEDALMDAIEYCKDNQFDSYCTDKEEEYKELLDKLQNGWLT